ncbi:helix-turn-helix domain-containing protein [Citricoccus sp. NPDC055426]|uniref:IclR family transcriptional regulator n=1 Tax=Citricoccus sp. NPDC055426 TaxID=3155536 RepID=UPI0034262D52
MARRSDGRSAVARICRVLEAFTSDDSDLTLTEIARRSRMPVSTVHSITGQLVDEGLLERMDQGYVLGVRLWELAIRAPGTFGLREAALAPMEQAHAEIRHHVQLSVLTGFESLYIERLSWPTSVVNFTQVGGRLPWYVTSSGILLASFADEPARSGYATSSRPPRPPAPDLDGTAMERLMASARNRGFLVTEGFIHPDATAVAVPVFAPWRAPVAALAAVVPAAESGVESVVGSLRQAARLTGERLAGTLTRGRP